MWFIGNYGVEIEMTLEQAQSASHQGRCDEDVTALAGAPDISAQLAKINPEDLRFELKDYGAWDDDELADHDANLERILWLAAGDIVDRQFENE